MGSNSKETVSSKHGKAAAHMNSETMNACVVAHKFKPDKIPTQRNGRRHKVPLLSTMLLAIDSSWKRGKSGLLYVN